MSDANWRDAYDQDFQLHENAGPKDEENVRRDALDVGSTGSAPSSASGTPITSARKSSYGDSTRRGSDVVEVNSIATVHRLLADPFSLLAYTKTMASCTTAMVHQLNAKALMTDDLERRDGLWVTAKGIADSTIDLVRAAKSLVQKQTEEEKKGAISSYMDSFLALHATLNMNVDDLEDVVGTGKLEAPKDDGEEAQQETDPAELLNRLAKMEENEKCADCGQDNPIWVSTSTCAFVCRECAEAHRLTFQSRVTDGPPVKQ